MTTAIKGIEGIIDNVDKWNNSYQRNNKRSGLKNLRCFPYCSTPHQSAKFCGRPAKILIKNMKLAVEDVIFYAQFHLADQTPSILEDGFITKSEAKSLERTRDQLNNLLYLGIVTKSDEKDTIRVVFNNRIEGWHYGHISSKHTSQLEHVLRFYILRRDGDELRLVHTFKGPAFTIYCRRRNRKRSTIQAPNKKRNIVSIEAMVWRVTEAILLVEQEGEKPVIKDGDIVCCDRCINNDTTTPTSVRSRALSDGFRKRNCHFCKSNLKESLIQKAEEKSLSQFLDLILPEFSTEEVEINSLSLEESENSKLLSKILGENDPFPSKKVNLKEILRSIGSFLVYKAAVAQSFEKISSTAFATRKKFLIETLAIKISQHIKQYGLTLENLDKLVQENKLSVKTIEIAPTPLADKFLAVEIEFPEEQPLTSLNFEERLAVLREMERAMTGEWLHCKRVMVFIDTVREDLGYPWILRKLCSQTFKKIKYHFENLKLESLKNDKVVLILSASGVMMLKRNNIKMPLNQPYKQIEFSVPFPPWVDLKFIPSMKAVIDYNNYRIHQFQEYAEVKRLITSSCLSPSKGYYSVKTYQTRENKTAKWKTKMTTEFILTKA